MKLDLKSGMKRGLVQEKDHIKERFPESKFDLADKIMASKPVLSEVDIVAVEPKRPNQKLSAGEGRVKRDTFSMPQRDYDRIGELREKCLKLGLDTSRSELVRAGILLLSQISASELSNALNEIVKLKPGRKKDT